jgi:hypothetical protein
VTTYATDHGASATDTNSATMGIGKRGRPVLLSGNSYTIAQREVARSKVADCRKRARLAMEQRERTQFQCTESELEWVLKSFPDEADPGPLNPCEIFKCVDLKDESVAPVLPPDVRELRPQSKQFVSTGSTIDSQRQAYWREWHRLKRLHQEKRRRYVPSFFHQRLLPTTRIISVAEVRSRGDSLQMIFEEHDGSSNSVYVAFAPAAADAVADFGKICVGQKHVRHGGGDGGTMVAWGDHVPIAQRQGKQPKVDPFANSRGKNKKSKALLEGAMPAAIAVSTAVKEMLPVVADDFRHARATFPAVKECYGGADVLSEQFANSVDLYNAAHIDFDRVCYTQWAETKVGNAKNWFLLFPNVLPMGLAVELTHGVGVSWVGEFHPHCTPVTNKCPDNHTYGFWMGVKNNIRKEYNTYPF